MRKTHTDTMSGDSLLVRSNRGLIAPRFRVPGHASVWLRPHLFRPPSGPGRLRTPCASRAPRSVVIIVIGPCGVTLCSRFARVAHSESASYQWPVSDVSRSRPVICIALARCRTVYLCKDRAPL